MSATPFEQNSPVLTVTRRVACCGFTARSAWLADERNPVPPAYVLRELDRQVDHHACKLDALLPEEQAA